MVVSAAGLSDCWSASAAAWASAAAACHSFERAASARPVRCWYQQRKQQKTAISGIVCASKVHYPKQMDITTAMTELVTHAQSHSLKHPDVRFGTGLTGMLLHQQISSRKQTCSVQHTRYKAAIKCQWNLVTAVARTLSLQKCPYQPHTNGNSALYWLRNYNSLSSLHNGPVWPLPAELMLPAALLAPILVLLAGLLGLQHCCRYLRCVRPLIASRCMHRRVC
jgi:hypothetical protein